MKVLVTGSAGFIGFHTCLSFIKAGYKVYGIDNINDYYDPKLKFDRLTELGFKKDEIKNFNKECRSSKFNNFYFSRVDVSNYSSIKQIFNKKFDTVCHLAAQAGVRYSIKNPQVYIESNINGFLNILECCRNFNISHLVYASSSSVYGESSNVPFKTTHYVDNPISLYAATKKSNELMAHTYSHLFKFKTTGLRFFTVYGPWGRPDMSYFLFAEAISNDKKIKIFNNGNMSRDFTYIDDIVNGIKLVIENSSKKRSPLYKILNIGNGNPQPLMNFIDAIERSLGKKSKKEFYKMQPGDVTKTWADITEIKKLGYKTSTNINVGVDNFIKWFNNYKKI